MTTKRSLKYNRLLKNIPTSKTLKEAATKAGYAPSTCKSNIYSMEDKIRQDLALLGYSKDAIQEEFQRLSAKCEQIGDMSNAMRGTENIAKIQGMYQDKGSVNTAIFNLTPADSDRLRSKLSTSRSKSNDSKVLGDTGATDGVKT